MIGLILLLALGCGRSSDWQAPDNAGALFPHDSGYAQASGHGADFVSRGEAACSGCHDVSAESAFCTQCHGGFPHPDGWNQGATHGEGRGDEAGREPCMDCHGAADTHAGAMGCSGCHASYPHPAGWGGATRHGSYAVARGGAQAPCGPCHGGELTGSETAPGCDSCHAAYPHGAEWAQGHGAWTPHEEDPVDPAIACAGCHGAGDGGAAGVACARCHDSYPHPAAWTQGHVTWSAARGEGSCGGCHQDGDGPASMPATCAPACHGGAK
jgi:hypothetical protein